MNPQPKKKRIKLSKKKESELREQVWIEQKGLCADCKNPVNLHGDTIFNTAHLRHIKSKGSGGDDLRYNREIACYKCHMIKEHGPRWGEGE